MTAVSEKQAVRDRAAEAIAALSNEERIVRDAHIATHLTHTPFWTEAEVVLGYMALDDEVDLQAVFRAATRAGKVLALPRIDRDAPLMEFRIVEDYPASLERHPYGFLQPSPQHAPVDLTRPLLVLVPGRMFDRRGYRVGRGGGFYDRFLSTLPDSAVTVGIGYSVQLTREVPAERGDEPVQIVVTDSESCFCRRPAEPG